MVLVYVRTVSVGSEIGWYWEKRRCSLGRVVFMYVRCGPRHDFVDSAKASLIKGCPARLSSPHEKFRNMSCCLGV